MRKIGIFRLESTVCILCSKFVWGHLHKTEVRQRKEGFSSCDDECLVVKKTAISQLVLLIRETDYTIFIVWVVPQTILQKRVCCFTTGWVTACCTFVMLHGNIFLMKTFDDWKNLFHSIVNIIRVFFVSIWTATWSVFCQGWLRSLKDKFIHFILIWVSNYQQWVKAFRSTSILVTFKVFSSKWCETFCIEEESYFVCFHLETLKLSINIILCTWVVSCCGR